MILDTQRREPGQIVLFSGHMIDAADRQQARFPPEVEPIAAKAIADSLAGLGVGPDDLGITEGASGGDLLFAEALLARGARLELRLPFPRDEFIETSVAYRKNEPPADEWAQRFHAVAGHARTSLSEMADQGTDLPEATDPYEQCNLWMLRDTLALGVRRACAIFLWDGAGADGNGGTAHMMQLVRASGCRTIWLDTRRLWSLPQPD